MFRGVSASSRGFRGNPWGFRGVPGDSGGVRGFRVLQTPKLNIIIDYCSTIKALPCRSPSAKSTVAKPTAPSCRQCHCNCISPIINQVVYRTSTSEAIKWMDGTWVPRSYNQTRSFRHAVFPRNIQEQFTSRQTCEICNESSSSDCRNKHFSSLVLSTFLPKEVSKMQQPKRSHITRAEWMYGV